MQEIGSRAYFSYLWSLKHPRRPAHTSVKACKSVANTFMAVNTRQSNIELLRIVAMFMVLLVHADFYSIGAPSAADCTGNPMDAMSRVYFQAIGIACVNIFVGISGWFGIHPTAKGIGSFLFQCLFWIVGIYLVALSAGTVRLSIDGLKECLLLTSSNWFIKAYVLLYILSPVMNTFAAQAPRQVFRNVLLSFFVFQSIYGWMFPDATAHIRDGYSTISFIGIYLLMRYIRMYLPDMSRQDRHVDLKYMLIAPVGVTAAYCVPPLMGINTTAGGFYWISYISPYTIALAAAVILSFSRLQLQNRFINRVAASSFAVFLAHYNTHTINHYTDCIRHLYNHCTIGGFWVASFLLMAGIFAVAVAIDQVRIKLWEMLLKAAASCRSKGVKE